MREAGDGTGQFGPALRPLDNWVRKSPVRLAELEGRKGGNCEAPPRASCAVLWTPWGTKAGPLAPGYTESLRKKGFAETMKGTMSGLIIV